MVNTVSLSVYFLSEGVCFLCAGSPPHGVLHHLGGRLRLLQPLQLWLRPAGHRLEHQHPRPAAGEITHTRPHKPTHTRPHKPPTHTSPQTYTHVPKNVHIQVPTNLHTHVPTNLHTRPHKPTHTSPQTANTHVPTTLHTPQPGSDRPDIS